jgi:hypothetical protein
MRGIKLLLCISLCSLSFSGMAQDFYFDEPERDYVRSGTFMIGTHWNKFDPLFNELNFRIDEQSGLYDFTGTIYSDSTEFANRSNYFGLGFNINGVQCLMSGSFRRTSASNFYQLGFGMGFNQILHFSYKTGQPLIWFEGLINYNFLKHNTRLKRYDIGLFSMMIIDGVQFPDIGFNTDGTYRLNVEMNRHILEPVGALNFAVSRNIGIRFAAGYSFFLNGNNADLYLRYKPLAEDNSGAKADQIVFNRNIDNISIDGAKLTADHFDIRKWNFNISIVFRMIGEKPLNPNYY